MDWKSWTITLFFICMNVPNGGLNTFSAQIVSGLGFSTLTTTLLGMPTGVIQGLVSLAATVPTRYFKDVRCLSAACCCVVPLVCSIVIRSKYKCIRVYDDEILILFQYCLPRTRVAVWLLTTFSTFSGARMPSVSHSAKCFASNLADYLVLALSLPMANTAGHTKKITVNAMVFTAYWYA